MNRKKEHFKDLIELSKIDHEILEAERQKRKIPSRLSDIQMELTKGRSTYQNLLATVKEKEARKIELENENLDFTEKISKSKNKLYDIKTNEAYKMALKEINNWEHEIKLRETEILDIMEYIEDKTPKIKKLIETFKPEEEKFLSEEKNCILDLEKIDKIIKDLNNSRGKNLKSIDQKILRQYDRIRKAKGGLALVEVFDSNCNGCNMAIRAQVFNQLINGEVLYCPNCSRLIYYTPPQETEDK